MSQRTGRLRRPCSTEASSSDRIAGSVRADRSGVKPRSCMNSSATTTVTSRSPTRTRNGTPRFVAWAITPPSTEPPSIAAPVTAWPRPKTVVRSPAKPVAVRASTSHASTAPEKKVKPSPIAIDDSAHAQNGAPTHQSRTYTAVVAASVSAPSTYESRRPRRSATTPVGISNSIIPAVKNALAANASRFDRPASSRNRVLMPQISEAESVVSRVRPR